MAEPEKLPKPSLEQPEAPVVPVAASSAKPKRLHRNSYPAKLVGIVGLCVASSALTAWLLLTAGVIKPDATETITENREKIVLQEGEIVADVFEKVSPSTVAITSVVPTAGGLFVPALEDEDAGSGIIISKNGYILTNKHVVPQGATRVAVILADGREFTDVTIVGRDPLNDIAFLKINGVNDLPAAAIGDSGSIKPGQKVVAIGNALGEFRNSVTSGIISGTARPVEAETANGSSEKLENLFQTDAAINPGNSGGPLVNLQGEVIGVNTAIAEDAEGIGFAIPINDVKGLIKSVLEQNKILKPYLGVRYLTLDRDVAQQLSLPVHNGIYVTGGGRSAVITGSPADKAGLRERDIITKVNNNQITETSSLSSLLAQHAPGDKIKLTILRDGQEQTVEVTLEAYPIP